MAVKQPWELTAAEAAELLRQRLEDQPPLGTGPGGELLIYPPDQVPEYFELQIIGGPTLRIPRRGPWPELPPSEGSEI